MLNLRYTALLVLFTISLFVSATLLFLIQPMFSKMVLPRLGGTPAVWITCMVFYQAALLGGYVYAHVTAGWLGVRWQAVLHLGLLGSAFLVLPIAAAQGWVPPLETNPAPWLLMLLLVSVGLPFFVISTTAPMLQKWFAHTGHPAAHDPYFLYAASNLGSMVALLGYPTVVEPYLNLARQAWVWSVGYGLLAALIVVCGVMLWRSPESRVTAGSAGDPANHATLPTPAATSGNLTVGRRLWWVLWSFAPSSLLLGVTTYLTTDIAAVPLLWVIPLALYLLTFVLVFARKPPLRQDLMVGMQPFVVLPVAIMFLWGSQSEGTWVIPLHLLAFFVTAMVCHGELAQSRPPTAHLTEYYLWIAVGGVLGGLFNAVVAPLIFKSLAEYPLAIAVACLLRPRLAPGEPRLYSRVLDVGLPLVLGGILAALVMDLEPPTTFAWISSPMLIMSCLAVMLCYSFSQRPIRFGLGVGMIMLAGLFYSSGHSPVIYGERSFFGVLQVRTDPTGYYHALYHGTTLHGAQSTDPARSREPLAYYLATGPVGQVFGAFLGARTPREVAIVGLGAGSLACYASPGQHWTFFEIDPAVERIARDERFFTYLKDCLAKYEVVMGDARLSLVKDADHRYGLIVFDAFTSDAVPVHLINREAIRLYLDKLAEGGMLLFNISNRYLDLQPVLGNLAQDAGLVALVQSHDVTEEEQNNYYIRTNWVVMARKQADLRVLAENEAWQPLAPRPELSLWTDDFSDILSVFLWPSFKAPQKIWQMIPFWKSSQPAKESFQQESPSEK